MANSSLNIAEAEALVFDNGRLKTGSFNQDQVWPALCRGRGHRLCPCGRPFACRAETRLRRRFRHAERLWRHLFPPPGWHQPPSLHGRKPDRRRASTPRGSFCNRSTPICAPRTRKCGKYLFRLHALGSRWKPCAPMVISCAMFAPWPASAFLVGRQRRPAESGSYTLARAERFWRIHHHGKLAARSR